MDDEIGEYDIDDLLLYQNRNHDPFDVINIDTFENTLYNDYLLFEPISPIIPCVELNINEHLENNPINHYIVYKCGICAKIFDCQTKLKTHLIVHSAVKIYRCNKCPNIYEKYNDLKIHKKTHANQNEALCNICNKKFASSDKLRIHNYIHTGEKPFTCVLCNKKFYRLDKLKVHHRVHTREKKFKCYTCNKDFAENKNLRNHILRFHIQ
ncbi:putative zinc-finger containing protein [Namao virus]|nr:putative zinc-finger containing protein [Namao virus]